MTAEAKNDGVQGAQSAAPRSASRIFVRNGLWVLVAVALAVLGASFQQQAVATLRFTALNLVYMAPIIIVACGLSAYVRASGADGLMARVFAGRIIYMTLAAALFGAVTPLCGVGVLPIISGLLAAGVPLAPIMAFWLSSPITDPAMLAITIGTLGMTFAVAKTAAAVGIGIAGGVATQAFLHFGVFSSSLKGTPGAMAGSCSVDRCSDTVLWRFWREKTCRTVFANEAKTAGLLMIKWLTLAFVLESVVTAYLPTETVAQFVGAQSVWAIPIAVGFGTPLYLDGYAALPLVRGLMDLGMSDGAALAFLVSGGITSVYASIAVFALVKPPLFLWYLVLAVLGSTLAGYGFDLLLRLAGSW